MSAIQAQLLIIAARLNTILSRVGEILAWFPSRRAATVTIEDVPYHVLDNTTDIRAVTELMHGYPTDITDVVNLLQINTASPHPATLTDILAAFGTIPVYTLPETPPEGYGNGLSGTINVPQLCELD